MKYLTRDVGRKVRSNNSGQRKADRKVHDIQICLGQVILRERQERKQYTVYGRQTEMQE